jgi:hypothetical protein
LGSRGLEYRRSAGRASSAISGVSIAVRPGIEGIKGFADLKGRRVAAIVGSM